MGTIPYGKRIEVPQILFVERARVEDYRIVATVASESDILVDINTGVPLMGEEFLTNSNSSFAVGFYLHFLGPPPVRLLDSYSEG